MTTPAPTPSSPPLLGRTAIVTGASRGIGLAVARGLVEAGASVCLTARDPGGMRAAVGELRGLGGLRGRITGHAGSAGDAAHIEACVALTVKELGGVDILVNNAAANTPFGPLVDIDPDAWRDAFAVNVDGPLRFVQCAWRAWMRAHGGTVVNICTEGAQGVGPNIGAYGTSKAALLHLTRQLAGELAPTVRVNSVSPGLVRTEMARFVWENAEPQIAAGLPMGRIGEPDDIARAVLWLVSGAASWITGTDLVVDGGTRVRAAHITEPAAGTGNGADYAVHERLRAHRG
ncbi:SDR family oxidoreductase [Streptomyces sp. H10-C2]|uniref:SDR family oxidoreductase n=1 Tax=unclassified Streptomyces TaxID=2593676 RepID=UPI0024B8989C|nr:MULTISPECIES: SDR family oxidoreductase [unclassified Streptomyces]MDJ0341833.1 SDR family oxidoreductase [Streptomyces sp. PH10-H1]MDJ0370413.1 SDR family oxidoreductase [Streptomyces sp. H10-C2]